MKLIIQIPAWNEEQALPQTIASLPRALAGIDRVEWLVIDDGSTDETIAAARGAGVDHVVRLGSHQGLASAFQAGLDAALKLGADVIVNTDADGQYDAADIPRLIAPVLSGEADMVVGDRELTHTVGAPLRKRWLQRIGAAVVRRASDTRIADPTSGFRAYSREAAISLGVVSSFTYTLESIIQAGKSGIATAHVPVGANPETRPSRLFPSLSTYVRRNGLAIFRSYSHYEPLRVFWTAALLVALVAAAVWGRFLWLLVVEGSGRGHVQSLIFGAVLMNAAMLLGALGVIGDLIYAQRVLAQRTLERVRRIELTLRVAPSRTERGAPPDSNGDPDLFGALRT